MIKNGYSIILIFKITEFTGVEILKCLNDFFPAIHHEWTVGENWFV